MWPRWQYGHETRMLMFQGLKKHRPRGHAFAEVTPGACFWLMIAMLLRARHKASFRRSTYHAHDDY